MELTKAASLLVGALLAAGCLLPAFAGPLDDGLDAQERKDYATAMRLLLPLAEKGNRLAQHNVGIMHDFGQGVPQNHAEALKWYRLAAASGFPPSQGNIGIFYLNGTGVPKNDAEAAKWLTLSAQGGYPTAQFQLGLMYFVGRGVAKNLTESYKWLTIAMQRGHPRAEEFRRKNATAMTQAQIAEANKLAKAWMDDWNKPRK